MGSLSLFPANLTDEVERPEGVRTVWLKVTPHWATKVLEQYEQFCDAHPELKMNRSVSQGHVTRLATDMKSGMWGRNHQGLAFDKNDVLMDGQHRLWAVVESGATVMMQITYGLDREAQLTIDVGKGRSTVDVLAIAGYTDARPLHVGVMKALVRGISATKPNFTRMQEIELMQRHKAAVEFALSLFPKTRVMGIMRAPVLAVIARAFYTQDHGKLKRFAEVLATGQRGGDDSEAVIVTLNQWLLSTKSLGGAAALESYGKTSRALQAYLRGERIRILYKSNDELFSLPVLSKRR